MRAHIRPQKETKIDKAVERLIFDTSKKQTEDWHESGGLLHYSTNVSSAWTVVEAMKKRSFSIDLTNYLRNESYRVVFQSARREHYAEEETVSMAICVAALRTVGHEL